MYLKIVTNYWEFYLQDVCGFMQASPNHEGIRSNWTRLDLTSKKDRYWVIYVIFKMHILIYYIVWLQLQEQLKSARAEAEDVVTKPYTLCPM